MTALRDRGATPAGSEAVRRKRLGQYFTDAGVARLLATLAEASSATSIIDPMVGQGDILLACRAAGAADASLSGIDIDPGAIEAAAARLDGSLLAGSAFSLATMRRLARTRWDLVITNPPYVRYQSISRGTDDELALPDARAVRANLLELVDEFFELSDEDAHLFRGLIGSYSGFADLAVPSWLLCAALVREGGRLAMVVPTTWLSREYSLPIRYLLARAFEIECVVEDGDATWFTEALVRTTLVVARRVSTRPEDLGALESAFPYGRLTAADADERGPVGRLFADAVDPDAELLAALESWRAEEASPSDERPVWSSSHLDLGAIKAWAADRPWRRPKAGEADSPPLPSVSAPHQPFLRRVFDGLTCRSLEDLGWAVGQGLRTGANDFFYVTAIGEDPDGLVIRTSEVLGGEEVRVPAEVVRPVLRRQAELPERLRLLGAELRERLLDLGDLALPEDIEATGTDAYEAMSESLAAHVRRAAELNLGTAKDPRLIRDLSAVRTNARAADPDRNRPPRFWYQLPPLRPRHRPALMIARINNRHPRCYLNAEGTVVDANFSTLWPVSDGHLDPLAMAAVLNSSWTTAWLETRATVLGGGALKVEAAHLRRLAVPAIDAKGWRRLRELGERLGESAPADETREEIDAVLIPDHKALELVRELCASRLANRGSP